MIKFNETNLEISEDDLSELTEHWEDCSDYIDEWSEKYLELIKSQDELKEKIKMNDDFARESGVPVTVLKIAYKNTVTRDNRSIQELNNIDFAEQYWENIKYTIGL